MLKVKFASILLTFLLGACTFGASEGQGKTSVSKGNSANQIPSPDRQSETSNAVISDSTQKASCPLRPLNPDSTPKPSDTVLDSYFRLAYDVESEGNFDAAIINYRKAAELATCECERSHAMAGEQAAKEAKELLEAEEIASKPTQFFWFRLQELTQLLPCVTK